MSNLEIAAIAVGAGLLYFLLVGVTWALLPQEMRDDADAWILGVLASLRQRTVFSDHSLASDSVFAELHLVSCRNVLIYFDRPLQDRALGLFKEALVRKGFLGIGARESLRFNAHVKAFGEFLPPERIYQKWSHA